MLREMREARFARPKVKPPSTSELRAKISGIKPKAKAAKKKARKR
jgi:hypothetical protein